MRCWPDWPAVRLPDDEAGRFLSGPAPPRRTARCTGRARLWPRTRRAFLGSAHITAGELIADRLLSPLEVQALIASLGISRTS